MSDIRLSLAGLLPRIRIRHPADTRESGSIRDERPSDAAAVEPYITLRAPPLPSTLKPALSMAPVRPPLPALARCWQRRWRVSPSGPGES